MTTETMETREQYLEKMLTGEKPVCPHCHQEMTIWEVPPLNFSDGMGWCAPYLFVCFNDECPLYKSGWKDLEENFGQTASYRCMCYRDSENFECMPVFSPMGATGQIIDNQALLEQEMLREAIKKGFSILAGCYVDKDEITITRLLLDTAEPTRVRMKAAEMLGDIGSMEAIDTIRNVDFQNNVLQRQVESAVKKLHERHFTRECPYCTEIIKRRASICKKCGRDVSGV
ncbi:MAG: zinc ribbon domain-containing protein [Desulfobacterales bacterium]